MSPPPVSDSAIDHSAELSPLTLNACETRHKGNSIYLPRPERDDLGARKNGHVRDGGGA